MAVPRKYIYFVLTMPQLELSLAVLKSHVTRLQAQQHKIAGTEAAKLLESSIEKASQVFDLLLQSHALRRARTKLIVTTRQFDLICQAIGLAKQRVEKQLLANDKSNEAKHTLLDYLEELEATLAQANHEPTRFDISGADAFKNTELGIRVSPLTYAMLG